jgi:hypothetical protein
VSRDGGGGRTYIRRTSRRRYGPCLPRQINNVKKLSIIAHMCDNSPRPKQSVLQSLLTASKTAQSCRVVPQPFAVACLGVCYRLPLASVCWDRQASLILPRHMNSTDTRIEPLLDAMSASAFHYSALLQRTRFVASTQLGSQAHAVSPRTGASCNHACESSRLGDLRTATCAWCTPAQPPAVADYRLFAHSRAQWNLESSC